MTDRFPDTLKERRDELVEEAEKIGLFHDGCKDPANEKENRDAKIKLNGKVLTLANDYHQQIRNVETSAPRLGASQAYKFPKRKKTDNRTLVKSYLEESKSVTEAGASSKEAEDTDDDETDGLQEAMESLTVKDRKIPGTPTGSSVTGAEAENNLSEVIKGETESKKGAFTTKSLGITNIDRTKKKTLHKTYPYIIGIPDGIVNFTIGAKSYPKALLEIKSTTERTATEIIKDGEIVKTHSRPILSSDGHDGDFGIRALFSSSYL